jgi:probable DNA repair protein
MYDWLSGALEGSSQVVTANRRLARVLVEHHASTQLDAGKTAWHSPAIMAWQDWLSGLLATAELLTPLPTRLNLHQSRVLWERCLRREISSPLLNTGALVRQSWDAWTKLNDYCVPLDQVTAMAQGRDQRIFASAATSYQSILEREGWVDDAGIAQLVVHMVRSGYARSAGVLTFAGFDRFTPVTQRLLEELRGAATRIVEIRPPANNDRGQIAGYENTDAEMRAAGAWARQVLLDDPSQVVAIVAPKLEREAERCARLIREGLVPGWQAGGHSHRSAVNVSYGSRLSAYPAVAVALLLLRWLHEDISSQDVSMLLRSRTCGDDEMGARSRLDFELRRLPAISWSPSRFQKSFERTRTGVAASDWFDRMRFLDQSRTNLAARATPSQWAVQIDEFLKNLNWPGAGALDSVEFQLVNRWRELLNDLARLQLVVPAMTFGEVLSRLQTLAGETVFQPESEGAIVQLLGPLEAAGMQFDQLWVCGLSSANWPPAGRPSPLVSRQLQRDYSMPDAEPANTLAYASRVLQRLAASTRQLSCSYPLTDGDAEQSQTGLIAGLVEVAATPCDDPGWYARELVHCASTAVVDDDHVPPVTEDEIVTGGAATLQRQLTDPFTAFASGRLGIRPVQPFVDGLPANIRGSVIHDALHALYRELPSREQIASWEHDDIERRSAEILRKAFARLDLCADATLQQLLKLERQRVLGLLGDVIALDAARSDFTIEGLEESFDLVVEQVRLGLRIDRIDRVDNDELMIIDYKTGQHRKFLGAAKEPDDLQLVAYSSAVDGPVAGLAFINVDSRRVSLDGAGRDLTPDLDWDANLAQWRLAVKDAALGLQRGDIRINAALPAKSSRAFGLLSRIRELHHDE